MLAGWNVPCLGEGRQDSIKQERREDAERNHIMVEVGLQTALAFRGSKM